MSRSPFGRRLRGVGAATLLLALAVPAAGIAGTPISAPPVTVPPVAVPAVPAVPAAAAAPVAAAPATPAPVAASTPAAPAPVKKAAPSASCTAKVKTKKGKVKGAAASCSASVPARGLLGVVVSDSESQRVSSYDGQGCVATEHVVLSAKVTDHITIATNDGGGFHLQLHHYVTGQGNGFDTSDVLMLNPVAKYVESDDQITEENMGATTFEENIVFNTKAVRTGEGVPLDDLYMRTRIHLTIVNGVPVVDRIDDDAYCQ